MSYTPTNWQTGDTITAERLNKLENGVVALSNYDFALTSTGSGVTADGLSFEELFQKGARNLNVTFDNEGMFAKAIAFQADSLDGINTVVFAFYVDISYTFFLRENGTASINSADFTYTYSNGHYVFTPSGSGGVKPVE